MKPLADALEDRVAQLLGELEKERGQKKRLESELEARTRELTATGDVLKVISRSAFDLQTVLDTLTESAARLCGADTAIIRRREGDAYPVAATYGLTATQRDHFAIYPTAPSRESVFGRAVMECRTIHVQDVLADPEYNRPQLQDFVTIRAMLGVPLMRDGVPVGVFTLQRREPQPYTQQQIELVTTFADQAVIAIENVRLFEEVQARTVELSEALQQQTATADVLKVISRSTFDLQAVFDTLVDSAARLCRADRAAIHRLKDGHFVVVATYGLPPQFKEFMLANPMGVDRGSVSGRAALEGRAVHIPDVLADPEFTKQESQQRGDFRTVLGVPLTRAGSPIGAIFLTRAAVDPFTQQQIDLVTTFADQAVIAIENVRLFEQVQARTEQLSESLRQQTATADVLKVISRSTFDLQTVLDTLVESATRLCDAGHSLLFLRHGDVFRWGASYGQATEVHERLKRYFKGHPIPVDRGSITGRAALEARVVDVADVLADPDYTWGEAQRISGYRAAIGVPLFRERTVVGVIFVAKSVPEPFTANQIELVTTFADQAVIAIENVRLFDEVQARTAELQQSLEYQTATSEVLNVISRSPSEIQPVLDAISETAGRLCDAYDTIILLREMDALKVAAHVGSIPLDFQSVPIQPGAVSGRAVIERQPIHVHDVLARAEEFPEGEAMGSRMGYRTILAMPMVRDNAAIGAIIIRRAEVRPFSEKQISLLQTFADQAVIAINNVRLFEEVQARTAELQESLEYQTATSDVLNVISRAPSQLQPVFDAIVETAARLCEADYAVVHQRRGGSYHVVAAHTTEAEYINFLLEHPIPPERGSVVGKSFCLLHEADLST